MIGRLLCLIGLHSYPIWVEAHWQAPAPVRCGRCGRRYGSDL